ncbi:integrase core domain-containing protein [Streptomyces sp. NPDC057554]|uniref:integrase core domain-containing protein n=1 Tax=Streptomyces sp. NPDC057554 TaxID=3350538 RepID=UPI0036911370
MVAEICDDHRTAALNALMEPTTGVFKTEVIKPRRPWKTLSHVGLDTAEWVDCYNHRRLHGETGHIPPAEHEANHYRAATKPHSQPPTEISNEPGAVRCPAHSRPGRALSASEDHHLGRPWEPQAVEDRLRRPPWSCLGLCRRFAAPWGSSSG